jgi:phosphoglycolate phosphatase
MTPPTIVFDLDGTLVDTAGDLIATMNAMFAREGVPQVALEDARNMVGGGVKPMIERGLTAHGRTLGPGELDHFYAEYLGLYAEHIADHSRPFPGVEAALDDLAALGYRFAVCTNKLEWLSLRLLDALNLTARFAAICGQDTFGVPKPNPAILRQTIARAGGEAKRAIMVGDSITDIATARAAGVPVVAVTFGYSATPVTELGPDRVVERYVDLPAAVRDLVQAQV